MTQLQFHREGLSSLYLVSRDATTSTVCREVFPSMRRLRDLFERPCAGGVIAVAGLAVRETRGKSLEQM